MRRMVTNAEIENIISNNIKTWYFIQGNFIDTGEVQYNIIPQYAAKDGSGRYNVYAIAWEDQQFEHINIYGIDFASGKIYNGLVALNIDGAKIELVNALTGEVEKVVEW